MMNPLLCVDTLSVVVDWINHYQNKNDTKVTLICLKQSSKFFMTSISIENNIKDLPRILSLSTIQNMLILKWFSTEIFFRDVHTSLYVVKKGDFETLKWCHKNQFHMNESTFNQAVKRGELT